MGKRNAKGDGSTYRKRNGWGGYITLGHDPKPIIREPSNITVKDWMRKWLEEKEPFIAHSTWRTYKGIIENHITPSLGRIKLND